MTQSGSTPPFTGHCTCSTLCRRLVCTLIVYTFCALTCVHADDAPRQNQILVFGGNGFIGSTTVVKLLEDEDNIVTITSRGNTYWDSKERIGDRAQQITCDRHKPLEDCLHLTQYVNSLERIDMVVDFSAYDDSVVIKALQLLKDTEIGLYVLISTDSVYEVCEKPDHTGFSQEDDAARPADKQRREWMNAKDDYGHRKLQAEEILRVYSSFPYVILRLPDVIGGRDGTHRWWIYQLWVTLEAGMAEKDNSGKVTVPTFTDGHHMSFVLADDVADLIVEMFFVEMDVLDKQIYNLGWEETFTLRYILDGMAEELQVKDKVEVVDEEQGNFYLYPSVKRGPVDVSKAYENLSWRPTDWDEAFAETVQFYNDAMSNEAFTKERDNVIQIVTNQFYGDRKDQVYETLEKIFDINLHHWKEVKDEL